MIGNNSIDDRNVSFMLRISKNKDKYILLAPFFLFFTIFTLIPVLISIPISFTQFNMLQFPQWVGWDNFSRLFVGDDVFLIAVKNTIVFAFLTGPISYFACLLFAWIINDLSRGMRTFFTFVFYAPSICGSVFFIWQFIFSGDAYGFANGLLMRFGLTHDPIQWLTDPKYNLIIVIIVQFWLSLGAGFLAFIAGFQGIDTTLYESGAIDGIKNRFQELIYITLPSMGPQLLFGAVMQIGASFAAGSVPVALTGFPSTDNSTTTVVTHAMDYGIMTLQTITLRLTRQTTSERKAFQRNTALTLLYKWDCLWILMVYRFRINCIPAIPTIAKHCVPAWQTSSETAISVG